MQTSSQSSYPFTITQLRYFVEIARYQNMTSAASRLHVTQPTLSAALKELEREYGVELFTRTSQNRLRITSRGKIMLAEAQGLLRYVDRFETSLRELSEDMSGELTIGVFSPIAPFWAPRLLREFKNRHPGVNVTFVDGNQETLQPLVLDGECDALIIYDLDLDSRIRSVLLAQIEPYVLTPSSPRFDHLPDKVHLSQLKGEPFILLDLPNTADYYLRIFDWSGTTPEITYKVDSYESVRSFVGAGLGYTLLHQGKEHLYTSTGERVNSRALAGEPPLLPIVFATSERGLRNRPVGAFLRVARDVFNSG